MNLLICIGECYRDFMPLNQYAQALTRSIFGGLDAIYYARFVKDISKTMLCACRTCLIAVQEESFKEVLEVLNMEDYKRESLHCLWGRYEQSKVVVLDLQEISQEELMQIPKHRRDTLYLYPLGVKSSLASLKKLAKEFGVQIQALHTHPSLEVFSAKDGDLKHFEYAIKERFGSEIFVTLDLLQSIIMLLAERNLKITSAESCTGGLIAAALTCKSGASGVFDGGVISYANSIKQNWLGVDAENLSQFGAVSEHVVRDMLNGALRISGADFALATSGVAGPSGGSVNKPVGTVYVGVKSIKGLEEIMRFHFDGSRNFIQEQATLSAYVLFLKIFFKSIDFY